MKFETKVNKVLCLVTTKKPSWHHPISSFSVKCTRATAFLWSPCPLKSTITPSVLLSYLKSSSGSLCMKDEACSLNMVLEGLRPPARHSLHLLFPPCPVLHHVLPGHICFWSLCLDHALFTFLIHTHPNTLTGL